jgi:hypothetical protein
MALLVTLPLGVIALLVTLPEALADDAAGVVAERSVAALTGALGVHPTANEVETRKAVSKRDFFTEKRYSKRDAGGGNHCLPQMGKHCQPLIVNRVFLFV